MNNPTRLSIHLLTGFLGSGKTTFLQKVIAEPGFPSGSTALLINDAGPMNIDAKVFKGQAETVKALSGGCACCVVSQDLQREIRLLAKDQRIRQVWIEASGVAEVEDLLDRLTEAELPEISEVRRVIHVVDGLNYGRSFFNKALQHAQWRWADVILLSKADLISPEALQTLKDHVTEINPRALVLSMAKGFVSGDWTRGGKRCQNKTGLLRLTHSTSVQSCWLELPEPIQRNGLMKWLSGLPAEVYRVKGFVRFTTEPDQIYWIQRVGQGEEDAQVWPYESRKEELGLVLLGSEMDSDFLKENLHQIHARD
jgi:G3E family GTPase